MNKQENQSSGETSSMSEVDSENELIEKINKIR